MAQFDLFSIGHSNNAAERFVAMVRAAGAEAVADVRSVPFSRFFPWFSAGNLRIRLAQDGLGYLSYGEWLGGRPRNARLYREGIADYELMARAPEFQAALDQLQAAAARHRICLMCAEREPLDCHRCLLLARALAARGLRIGHILHDSSVEPHGTTEQRLLDSDATESDLFASGQDDRLAAAYRRRAHAVAYRTKSGSAGATSRSLE